MDKLKALLVNSDFWAAIAALVTIILVSVNVPQGSITQVTAIITAAGAFIAFVLGKAAVQIAEIKLKAAQIENETAKMKINADE
jgi:hypothetical protein